MEAMVLSEASIDAVEVLRELEERAKLRVYVLGPGPHSTDPYRQAHYEKRCQIRDALLAKGHEALFPEDVCDKAGPDPNLLALERRLLGQSDLIVYLVVGQGTALEFGRFGDDTRLAYKSVVLIDERERHGLLGKTLPRLAENIGADVKWYTYPSDVVECNLVKHVLDKVRKLAFNKLWELSGSHSHE